jgi:molybdopterin converting factor small subunit
MQVPHHVSTAGDVLALLRRRGSPWEEALAPDRAYRIAVDQRMGSEASAIRDGAELAVFPPVTGG